MSSQPSTEQDELAHSSSSEEDNSGNSNFLQTGADRWSSLISFMSSLLGTNPRSAQQPTLLNPTLKLEESKIDEELSCPICQDIMREVYATNCGHSFCHECITLHMENQPDCPLCRTTLTTNDLYPNFQLNRLAEYRIRALKEPPGAVQLSSSTSPPSIESIIQGNIRNPIHIANTLANWLPYDDLIHIFEVAIEKRKQVDIDEDKLKSQLLKKFLYMSIVNNIAIMKDIAQENSCISSDLHFLKSKDNQSTMGRKRSFSQISDDATESEVIDTIKDTELETTAQESSSLSSSSSSSSSSPSSAQQQQIAILTQRMEHRFDDLKTIHRGLLSPNDTINKRRQLLWEFSSNMYQLVRYDHYDTIDTLYYADSPENNGQQLSRIVSSIEFDRDDAFFATGGVTKEIKIFDFSMLPSSHLYIHCPTNVMTCGHKISCLSWSPYLQWQLASSDYEGCIDIWDCSRGTKTQTFTDHKRRAWSVDICKTNPTWVASGSDDHTVKVWSLTQQKAVHSLEQKGNVCCAKFAPTSSHFIAVGSADHHVSLYDLRMAKMPVNVYEGHGKAVSYVKWLNDYEIVSASTDSTLKLWDREATECKRTYRGHQNEKNFVGLSVNNDWISCGSERNTLYTYHKSSSIPVTQFKFPRPGEEDANVQDEDATLFVSSVCWKKNTNTILAANSQGIIKVLEMK